MTRTIELKPVVTGLMLDTGTDTLISICDEAIQDNATIVIYADGAQLVNLLVDLTDEGYLKVSEGFLNLDKVSQTSHMTEDDGSLVYYRVVMENSPSSLTVEVV